MLFWVSKRKRDLEFFFNISKFSSTNMTILNSSCICLLKYLFICNAGRSVSSVTEFTYKDVTIKKWTPIYQKIKYDRVPFKQGYLTRIPISIFYLYWSISDLFVTTHHQCTVYFRLVFVRFISRYFSILILFGYNTIYIFSIIFLLFLFTCLFTCILYCFNLHWMIIPSARKRNLSKGR